MKSCRGKEEYVEVQGTVWMVVVRRSMTSKDPAKEGEKEIVFQRRGGKLFQDEVYLLYCRRILIYLFIIIIIIIISKF